MFTVVTVSTLKTTMTAPILVSDAVDREPRSGVVQVGFKASDILSTLGIDSTKVQAASGRHGSVVSTFRSQWGKDHEYVIVGCGKARDTDEIAEDVLSTGQGGKLWQWYAADCAGKRCGGKAHRIVFGADTRKGSEFDKYGKASHANIATTDGVKLGRLITAVKAMAQPRATFGKLPPVGAVFADARTASARTGSVARLAAAARESAPIALPAPESK